MCGIAGFYSPKHSLSSTVIQRMTYCLSHRGPDAENFFSDSHVAFGHRRLSIIDLSSNANQPMRSHDGRWITMFNGEIFNFRELSAKINRPLHTTSDTEVMLEWFAAKGETAVEDFNGMFAIALYDTQEKILRLFRDRMGVKPLFYFNQGSTWFFGSEMKSLLALDMIRPHLTLNREALSLYFHLGYIPEPHTIWNEIKKFPAGSLLKISEHDHQWNSFWKPEERIDQVVISDLNSAKKKFHHLLASSVAMRMISDVPFGTFLSGGIDSTLVTLLAQQQSSLPVKTFTIGFKESKFNEAKYAAAIASYLKTDHHQFIMTYDDALALCEESIEMYDEPFADSSAIPTMLVSKTARPFVKMILSGDGGDELFMGYGAYRWAKRLHDPLIRTFRAPIAKSLSLLQNRYRRAGKLFEYNNEKNLAAHIASQEQYLFSIEELKKLLNKNFTSPEFCFPDSNKRPLSAAEKQALFDLKFYLKDDLLVKVDRATMRYSLECRTPFLDFRIVEFALNVNEKLKIKNDELKILPRMLLHDLLPPKLFERKKQGFAIPLSHWLKKELRHLIDKNLSEEKIRSIGLLDAETVSLIKQKFFSGRDYLYNRLWSLIIFQRWCEKNLR